jgi:Fe2+ or Zn2+ uptake regulation protein
MRKQSKKDKAHTGQLLELAKDKLSLAGFRITKPRQLILQTLIDSPVPLTVAEIYSEVSRKSAMDRVSTYRVVEVLQEQELIHSVGNSRFIFCSHLQAPTDHHLYLLCRLCSTLTEIDLPDALENAMAKQIRQHAEFKSHGQIQVYGECVQCPTV